MPEISRFLGIIITMFYNDHTPPHFHAEYGEYEVLFSIKELRIIKGKLPGRVAGLVLEWATLHQEELLKDWELCEKEKPLNKIPPLV